MQVVAKLLNDYGLFQFLSDLPIDRSKESTVRQLERFLFRGCCLVTHLETMKDAEAKSVYLASQYYGQITWPTNCRIGYSSESVFLAYSQIAPALSAVVDLQNQLLPILRMVLGINCQLKNSLRKELKNCLIDKGFPEQIESAVRSYWQGNGQYVRNLRDVSEHFMDLSGDALLERRSDPGCLLIFLPDNPEVKSPKAFTYEKENDAFEVLSTSLKEIDSIISIAATIAALKPNPFQQEIAFGGNGLLAGNSERTISLSVSVVSDHLDSDGNRQLVLDALEFGQKAAGDDQNAECWVRKPLPDRETEDK